MTMTLVSTVTVGAGGAASIEFTSIPQTGTDLLIMLSSRNTAGDRAVQIYLNSSYQIATNRTLNGNGSAASSTNNLGYMARTSDSGWTANTFGNASIYLPNYTSTTAKSASADSVGENNASSSEQVIAAGSVALTSAITSITLLFNSGNFAQYSTASLYTITKGSGGATVS